MSSAYIRKKEPGKLRILIVIGNSKDPYDSLLYVQLFVSFISDEINLNTSFVNTFCPCIFGHYSYRTTETISS